MEGVAVNMYRNLKGICTRRGGYKRLTVSNRRRRSTPPDLSSAADSTRRRRRFWRIRRLRLRLISPKKFLIKLRDAYVNFMLRLASSPAVAGAGYGGGGYGGVDYGVGGFGVRPVKEYDEKMIIEIYKSLVKAHGQLVVREAGSNNPPRDVDDLAIQRLR